MGSATMIISYFVFLLFFCNLAAAQDYTLAKQFHTNFFSDDDITATTPNRWIVSGASVPSSRFFSDCGGNRIFGGFNILSGDISNPATVQKTWSNLPPHYQAQISMKIYKVDSWSSQSFFVMVDGVSIEIYSWDSTTGTSQICGQANPFLNTYNPQYFDQIIFYSQTISHKSGSLTLKLTSNLQSWTGSWGIRQLSIILKRCHLTCLSCSNSTHCETCDSLNGLTLVGQFCECTIVSGSRRMVQTGCPVTRCVTCQTPSCPLGYYPFNLTSCASCNSACATCIGPGSIPTDCTSCNPQGYIDPGSGICTICFGFCASCTGILQNQCTSCKQGTFLINNQCLMSCTPGFYGFQQLKICIPCNSPCTTCDGSTNNHCLSCITGFYLHFTTCYNVCPLSMYGYNGVCQLSCPLGSYPDNTTIPICVNCPVNCLTCSQSGNCISCTSNAFFSPYDNLCHIPCPTNYYGDPSTKVCSMCDTSCLTCHGPTSHQCDSCPPLTYLVLNTCYSTCPPHTYSLTCNTCHQTCLNCTGPSAFQCTSCNKFDVFHINSSQCMTECFEGDISNNVEKTCLTCPSGYSGYFKQCKKCFETCQTCSNLWYTDCKSCVSSSAHKPKLVYSLNQQLNGQSIVFIQQSKTCIYKDTSIIYMPSVANSSSSIYKLLIMVVMINLGLALIMDVIFTYKTNLLITLETMQLLSYLIFFSSPFSQSNQIILLFLHMAHPTGLMQAINIHSPMLKLVAPSLHLKQGSIFPKALILKKTAIYIADTFSIHLIISFILFVFLLSRVGKNYCNLYKKINPYLLTYSFRLLSMQLFFSAILFFSYIQLSQSIMHWSLAFLLIDLAAIGLTFFWKVRTDVEPDHAHYAFFYFNELGPRKQLGEYKKLTQMQQKQRKSILPSMLYYISRLPLGITIILFHKDPFTQSISLFIYSVILFVVNIIIEHRRRFYRFMNLFSCFSLIICSMLVLMMNCGLATSIFLDYWILVVFTIYLIVTLSQIVTNHQFWSSIIRYLISRFTKPQNLK